MLNKIATIKLKIFVGIPFLQKRLKLHMFMKLPYSFSVLFEKEVIMKV